MNKTDRVTVQCDLPMFQACIKKLDTTLSKKKEYHDKYGRYLFDRETDDIITGCLNTIAMLAEDLSGVKYKTGSYVYSYSHTAPEEADININE